MFLARGSRVKACASNGSPRRSLARLISHARGHRTKGRASTGNLQRSLARPVFLRRRPPWQQHFWSGSLLPRDEPTPSTRRTHALSMPRARGRDAVRKRLTVTGRSCRSPSRLASASACAAPARRSGVLLRSRRSKVGRRFAVARPARATASIWHQEEMRMRTRRMRRRRRRREELVVVVAIEG